MTRQELLAARPPRRGRLIWIAACVLLLAACEPAQQAPSAPTIEQNPRTRLRLATFNASMGLQTGGELARALQLQNNPKLLQLAEIIQRVRPDILLLNEFDYDPSVDAAALLNENYLLISQNGQDPIEFPYQFRAPSNTGIDSGLDLDGNGEFGEPQDAWGFGAFPGQYGMQVLSRFPINVERSRSFQHFLWADLPEANRPMNPDGSNYYQNSTWKQLRLSSKSHWDLLFEIDGRSLHLLAFHPTPPVFDGPEDRNGLRNFDEIRFWLNYIAAAPASYLVDDQGRASGMPPYQPFVIAGDFNADPLDGDSKTGAASQLLDHRRINSSCMAKSAGGREAATQQAGINLRQQGDPALDTSDFNDEFSGNLRTDYLLPSRELKVIDCGVFWPAADEAGHDLVNVSDHRLVWLDVEL